MSDFVINFGQAGNHRRMQKPTLSGLHETFSYVEELPGDANAAFVTKFREKFPDEVFVSQPAQNTYFTIHLYAKAVEACRDHQLDGGHQGAGDRPFL